MIYEERIYTIKPGYTAEYLKNHEELALDILMECLGNLVGFWQTEHGPLNLLMGTSKNIWAFEGLDDRLARREKLARHPDWPVPAAHQRPAPLGPEHVLNGSCCPASPARSAAYRWIRLRPFSSDRRCARGRVVRIEMSSTTWRRDRRVRHLVTPHQLAAVPLTWFL